MPQFLMTYHKNPGVGSPWNRSAGADQEPGMPRELIIRPEAEAEMQNAFGWYEERVQGLGNEFPLAIDAVMDVRQLNVNVPPGVQGPQLYLRSRTEMRE